MRVHFFSNTDFTTYRYHINTWESLLLVLKDYEKQGQSKLNVKSTLKWHVTHLAAPFCIKKLKNYEHFLSLAKC